MRPELKDAILEMRAAAVVRRCRMERIDISRGDALGAVRCLDDTRAYQECCRRFKRAEADISNDGVFSVIARYFRRVRPTGTAPVAANQ
jgi:hypothetical protein